MAGQPCYLTLSGTHTATLGQYRAIWTGIIGGLEYPQTQYFEVVMQKTTYGSERDVKELLSDIPLPEGRDVTRYIKRAEGEVDSYLAGIYNIPVDITASGISDGAVEILENTTTELAAGYLLLSLAVVHENTELHAYAKSLVDRAKETLEKIKEGNIVLVGATLDDSPSSRKARFFKIKSTAPDGDTGEADIAIDDDSYFNKGYKKIGDSIEEPEGGVLD